MHNKKKKHYILKGILMIILLVVVAAGSFFFYEYTRKTTNGKEITVEIPEGTNTKDLIALLKKKGVIHFQLPFYAKLYQSEYKGKLRYGTFTLNDGMSLDDLIKELATGGDSSEEEETIVLTIPEGYTAEMIAERLEDKKIMSGKEFLQAVKDAAADFTYGGELPDEDEVYYQLQGYLFPDTYYLDESTTAKQLVDMLLDEFEKKYDSDCKKRAKELGMTTTEVLIRASLVQKETDLVKEYPIIAGVINNRLEQKMKLQFDSTVVYAMTEGKYGVDRVTYADLEYDSPYNTYQVSGLPVGPICNPGMDAIDAVLYPDENDYLFFQTDTQKNDGSNLFFETYEEHLAASSTAGQGSETTTATDSSVATTASEAASTDSSAAEEATAEKDATTQKSTETKKSTTTQKSTETKKSTTTQKSTETKKSNSTKKSTSK